MNNGRLLVCMPYTASLQGDYEAVDCQDCHLAVAVQIGSRDQAKLQDSTYVGCICESCAGDRLVGLKQFRNGKYVGKYRNLPI